MVDLAQLFKPVGAPVQYVTPGVPLVMGLPQGMAAPGNLNLNARPHIQTPEGVSTVRSMGVNFDGLETLLPRVVASGMLTPEQAIQQFLRSGQNLGRFYTEGAAKAYADQLHLDQARR